MIPALSPDRSRLFARLAVAVALGLLGLVIVGNFLPALVWAVVIAIAIGPLYTRAEERWPKHTGVLLPLGFTLVIALVVLVPVAVGIIQAAREAQEVMRWVVDARANGVPVPAWVGSLPFGAKEVADWWTQNLATPEATEHQLHKLGEVNLLAHSRLLGTGLIKRSVIFAFTMIALFFVLRDRDSLAAQMRSAGDRFLGPSGERLGQQMILSVRGTIDGLVLVGIGEGVLMAVVYLFLGVPHPLLIGAFTAIAAMIPFGAAVMFAVAALLLIGKGAVGSAIAVIVIGLIVVFIADHFIRPALIGGATRLPFVWVLIGILGGVERFGLLGLFVGPATMAALMMLWRETVGKEADPKPSPDAGEETLVSSPAP
jgi:predicted PurR-regulated permease PerM